MRHVILISALAIAASAQPHHPDLGGYWSTATITPFERPRELAGKAFFTAEEAAAFEKHRQTAREAEKAQAYNETWFDRGQKLFPTRRTSIVIDPPDGRIPALTPRAQQAEARWAAIQKRTPENPEDLDLPVRCILWAAGPPIVPGPYNNNVEIIQTADHVAIYVEMIHDVRIVPLDSRPHLAKNIRLWMGDPVGHWEGGTLVVDTTNFTDKTHFHGSDENLHLIERFTRTAPDVLTYRFTVDDPTAFTTPWTGEIVMKRTAGPLYEYACHEGNYALQNILRWSRP